MTIPNFVEYSWRYLNMKLTLYCKIGTPWSQAESRVSTLYSSLVDRHDFLSRPTGSTVHIFGAISSTSDLRAHLCTFNICNCIHL